MCSGTPSQPGKTWDDRAHNTLDFALSLSLSLCTEIVFGFSEEDFAGDESAGVITVTISKTASTAREISLTVTPTEYSDSFGPNSTFNPNSPNIATRKMMS